MTFKNSKNQIRNVKEHRKLIDKAIKETINHLENMKKEYLAEYNNYPTCDKKNFDVEFKIMERKLERINVMSNMPDDLIYKLQKEYNKNHASIASTGTMYNLIHI